MTDKVLVVDDSPMDRRAVGALLESVADLEVEFASTVDEALARLRQAPVQVVVTDLIMPRRDGLELVAAVVSEHPLTPVILITGKGCEETAVRALQAGAASYVPKALMKRRLVETLEHVLAMARDEQSQIRLMGSMRSNHCEFELENDPAMIAPLVNFLHRSIRTVGLCDENEGIRVCVALEEAVNNALFHGNLELNSALREADTRTYRRLVEQRRGQPPYRQRKVKVDVKLTRRRGTFVIRDEGPGFDPDNLPDPTLPSQIDRTGGRGLLLIRTFMDEVEFNRVGNEVTLVKLGKNAKSEAGVG